MSLLSSSASTLCERCRVLQINGQTPGCYESVDDAGRILLHIEDAEINLKYDLQDTLPDLPVLECSAVAGCQFCSLLREVIQDQTDKIYSEFSEDSSDNVITIKKLQYITFNHNLLVSRKPDARNGLQLLLVHSTTYYSYQVFIFEILGNIGSPVTQYLGISRRPVDVYALTPRNVWQIRAWLTDCDEDHSSCSALHDAYLPKRLIHIGTREGDNCRLINTADCGDSQLSSCRYIAYSYCWGPTTSPPPTTTASTLADRHASISIDIMPQGFRDLITVAHAIDVQYLWIDSLCIIQDDDSDWKRESAQMINVYRNAYLTIIAASTASPHEGFLYREPSRRLVQIPYYSSMDPRIEGSYLVGQYREGVRFYEEVAEVHSDSRWSARSWTMQEGEVCRRALCFGSTQFYFECQQHVVSEKCKIPRMRHSKSWYRWQDDSDNGADPYRRWYRTVAVYSGRDLSYSNDKLPAISALAQIFAQATGDTYLAGLWKKDISIGLLWERLSEPLKLASSYRAPSWCWSAYDGYIKWPMTLCEAVICCSVREVQTTSSNENVFGAVTHGYLLLSGKLASVALSQAKGDPLRSFDTAVISEGKRIAHGQLNTSELEATLVDKDNKVVWAVLVAKALPDYKSEGVSLPVGLILSSTPESGTTDLEFRRVGIFQCRELESADFFDSCSFRDIKIV